jgi:hypothetical protein
VAQVLQAVFAINDRYTSTLAKIMKSQDDFATKQNKIDRLTKAYNKQMGDLKNQADNAASGIGGLSSKIGGLISVAYLGKKALEGMFSAVNTAALQQVQESTFQALLNNDRIGSQLYKYVSLYAKTSALNREDIARGVTSALTVTRDIEQVEQFIKMTERLYMKDPTKGAQQAVFSLKELLAGDIVSARGVYGITGISGEKIRSMIGAGDVQGAFDYISASLDKFGASQQIVDKNFDSLTVQAEMFKTNMQSAVGEAATPVMEKLAAVAKKLNEEMEAGKFQPFINVMVNGMQMIGNGIVWVVDNLNWIAPTISGVVTALVVYKGVMMAVNAVQSLVGITAGVVTQNWLQAGAALVAFLGGAAAISAVTKQIDEETAQSLESLKNGLGKDLPSTELPVEITNTDPIKVSGEVDIEKESMRYLLDAATQKFYAEFSTATLAPQVNFYGTTFEQTTDLEEVTSYLTEGLREVVTVVAEGV